MLVGNLIAVKVLIAKIKMHATAYVAVIELPELM